jgi:hypothetical protein
MLNDPGRINGPQIFSIGKQSDALIYAELDVNRSTVMNSGPHGVTSLVQHVRDIRCDIEALESTLRRNGTKVLLIICTDGLPFDTEGRSARSIQQEIVDALRSLGELLVWLVVRLFTDDENIVKYYKKTRTMSQRMKRLRKDYGGGIPFSGESIGLSFITSSTDLCTLTNADGPD